MKKILIYLLILILSAPILSPWGTITYFVINQDYIKDVYCENKLRPELQCDGKCYLAQKLRQQKEASEKEALESLTGLSWACLYYQDIEKFCFEALTFFPDYPRWKRELQILSHSFLQGIFRPPRA